MKDKIQHQTNSLSKQLKRLDKAKTDEDYIKQLEIYNQMVKKADFSIEAQEASKQQKLTLVDKLLAPRINRMTKKINNINAKLIEHNKKNN